MTIFIRLRMGHIPPVVPILWVQFFLFAAADQLHCEVVFWLPEGTTGVLFAVLEHGSFVFLQFFSMVDCVTDIARAHLF